MFDIKLSTTINSGRRKIKNCRQDNTASIRNIRVSKISKCDKINDRSMQG